MESTIPDSPNDTNPNYASDVSSECDDSISEARDQVAYAAPRSFAFIDSMGRWGAQ